MLRSGDAQFREGIGRLQPVRKPSDPPYRSIFSRPTYCPPLMHPPATLAHLRGCAAGWGNGPPLRRAGLAGCHLPVAEHVSYRPLRGRATHRFLEPRGFRRPF